MPFRDPVPKYPPSSSNKLSSVIGDLGGEKIGGLGNLCEGNEGGRGYPLGPPPPPLPSSSSRFQKTSSLLLIFSSSALKNNSFTPFSPI